MARVLYLDAAGLPQRWISREDAAIHYAKDNVLWALGDCRDLRGGWNRNGERSRLSIAPVIAGREASKAPPKQVALTNANLFARDRFHCLYCGQVFAAAQLTRDHIVPRAQGGRDRWENVAAACRGCNQVKAARTPEQAGMPLLMVPFRPNVYEGLILQNRRILIDQWDYLARGLSNHRQWERAC